MPACLHPRDKTARAQILRKNENEKFYNLLNDFYKLTKRPSLLNTSFNLHGFPIVKDLNDAFYVFYNSKLDGLITDNFVILKK
jgi:carbamoyltransferase